MGFIYLSPIKGDDVSQQQSSLIVGEFSIQEKVLSTEEIWKIKQKKEEYEI